MHRSVVGMVALALAAVGCKGKARKVKRVAEAGVATGDVDDALFVMARPEVTAGPAPARFAAPLPATEQAIDGAPPAAYVEAMLAADGAGMRARMVAAVTAAAPPGEALRDYDVARLEGATPGGCDWIASVATGNAPPEVRAPFWTALASCSGPAIDAAFARDDAPDAEVIGWRADRVGARTPFDPRVARAAAAVAQGHDEDTARQIGFAFATMDGPQVVPAMQALQRSIADPERRALVALGLLEHPSADARALGRAACAQPRVAEDPMCDHDVEPRTDDAPADVAGAVTRFDYDQAGVLARFPRADVVAALSRCATDRDPRADRSDCLRRLAGLDRAAAVAIARRTGADQDDPALADVAAGLLAFSEDGAVVRELAGLGFTPVPHAEPTTDPVIDLDDALLAMGRLVPFDTETDQFPNEHDRLLARLAAAAAPALDGVLFEERAPADPASDAGYQLTAYADGKVYRLAARNLGDWYDVEAVVGLCDAILAARGSEVRLATLATGDQTSLVLAGPRRGITALARRKLIEVAAPGAGEEAGKEFEDRVRKQLEREGAR